MPDGASLTFTLNWNNYRSKNSAFPYDVPVIYRHINLQISKAAEHEKNITETKQALKTAMISTSHTSSVNKSNEWSYGKLREVTMKNEVKI